MKNALKITINLILMFLLVIMPTQEILAYPLFPPKTNLVTVAPYDQAGQGTVNSGYNSIGYRELLVRGQSYRLRQNGTVARVKIYTDNTTNLTGFYLKIWRRNDSGNYDLVGTSNNIASRLIAGQVVSIGLTRPIKEAKEGDYYGYRVEKSGPGYNLKSKIVTGVSTFLIDDITPSPNNFNWENQRSVTGSMAIEIMMQAPQFVFIGDSIIAGHPNHYSFIETTPTTNIGSTIEKQFANITGYSYQNMGIGGQTTTQIANRFAADVLNLKPRVVVVEGGINDLFKGGDKATFLSNWRRMLALAQRTNITVVVIKILPCSNASAEQMRSRDDWNASLEQTTKNYPNAIIVDASSYVGQFRPGGEVGNLWDISPLYSAGGTHFNQAGNAIIAQAIADKLSEIQP